MLNGILRPDSGEVRFSGRPLAYDNRSLRDLRRRVGFVFQNPDVQIIAPTVEADVAFGPVNLGLSPDAVRRAVRTLSATSGSRGYEKRPPHHLSGGEKKRVAIAGILAMEPAVLVFDEPTSSLDPQVPRRSWNSSTSSPPAAGQCSYPPTTSNSPTVGPIRFILMEHGRVLARGPPEEVFSDHDLLAAARLKPPALLDLYNELASGASLTRAPPKERA